MKDLLLVLWAMSGGYGVASLRHSPFIATLVSVVVLWRIVAVLWDSAAAMVRVLLLLFAVCEVLEIVYRCPGLGSISIKRGVCARFIAPLCAIAPHFH
jgi:hypothetical protein